MLKTSILHARNFVDYKSGVFTSQLCSNINLKNLPGPLPAPNSDFWLRIWFVYRKCIVRCRWSESRRPVRTNSHKNETLFRCMFSFCRTFVSGHEFSFCWVEVGLKGQGRMDVTVVLSVASIGMTMRSPKLQTSSVYIYIYAILTHGVDIALPCRRTVYKLTRCETQQYQQQQ